MLLTQFELVPHERSYYAYPPVLFLKLPRDINKQTPKTVPNKNEFSVS
jgi:hypothetical protein